MKKNVRVRYFAILREQRGLDEERVATEAATAGELYEELRKRHRFTLPADRLRVAINDDFGSWATAVRDGDALVFLPPVAGG
ncbi:MAG TPA: MoaD/ThiS family protein [Opitutaceae bacterium]|nr:MoaD/ThiS family protein [Opitutaceae bacterium]